jgi:hypothetical protein
MNARHCLPSPTPFNLTRSRFQSRTAKKDTKNAGRSEEVYENKGHDDIMPDKNSDFVSEIAKSAQDFVAFAPNFAGFFRENRGWRVISQNWASFSPAGVSHRIHRVLRESTDKNGPRLTGRTEANNAAWTCPTQLQ